MARLDYNIAQINKSIKGRWLAEELEENETLYFREGAITAPIKNDYRDRKEGLYTINERYDGLTWKETDRRGGSIRTDRYILHGEVPAEIVEELDDGAYINVWRVAAAPGGNEFGDSSRKMFLISDGVDGFKLSYTTPQIEEQAIQDVNTSTLGVGEYTTTFTSFCNLEVAHVALDVSTPVRARLVIEDIADGNRIIYATTSQEYYETYGGVALADATTGNTTGLINVKLKNKLCLVAGREYRITHQSSEGTVNSNGVFPYFVFSGSERSEENIATREWVATQAVASVNGKTGTVVVDKSDIELPNVNNTSDIDKPISNSTQNALNLKADTNRYSGNGVDGLLLNDTVSTVGAHIGNGYKGAQYYGFGAEGGQHYGLNAAGAQHYGLNAAGAQYYGCGAIGEQHYGYLAEGVQYYGYGATGTQHYGYLAEGTQYYGYAAIGEQQHGQQATGAMFIGYQATGAQFYGRDGTGAIEIGSAQGTDATKKMISGATSATFAQIISDGTSSDRRLKNNIEPIESALAKVKTLTGCTFDMKLDDGTPERRAGLIAQDVQKVLPEAVIEDDSKDKYLSVLYGSMMGLAVEAIKELSAKVVELETKLNK